MVSSNLSIEIVESQKQLNDFFLLKHRIYRGNDAVVFPLQSMERLQVDTNKHPFYQHADRQLFICRRDGEVVGRIAAIKDELHNEHCGDRVGFFGLFEANDDQAVVHSLIEAASNWLKEKGCDTIRGPVNPSMKSDFGIVVEGNELSPMIMMGYSLARYEQQLSNEGFAVAKQFFAYRFRSSDAEESSATWGEFAEIEEKIAKRYPKLTMKTVTKDTFEQTIREVNELGNVVRAEGWGFVPLTEAELGFMIKNLRRVIRYDMIHVAYWEDKLIGYIINIPDVNWALKRTWGRWDWLRMIQLPFLIRRTPHSRVIALGVDKNYRTKGVAMLLIQKFIKTFEAFDEWEFSWVAEDNVKSIRAISRTVPLVQTKTYQILEKPIV